jgi:hypothetical protein
MTLILLTGVVSPYKSFSTNHTTPNFHTESYQISSSQPNLIKSSSSIKSQPRDPERVIIHCALGHTLKLILADVDEARRVDDVGGEVVDHLGKGPAGREYYERMRCIERMWISPWAG